MCVINTPYPAVNDPNYVPEIGSTTATSKIPIKKNTVTAVYTIYFVCLYAYRFSLHGIESTV